MTFYKVFAEEWQTLRLSMAGVKKKTRSYFDHITNEEVRGEFRNVIGYSDDLLIGVIKRRLR